MPAILAQRQLHLGEILHADQELALVAGQGIRRAVGLMIEIGARRIEIDPEEIVKVRRVGRGGPGAAEEGGIAGLQPERRPASGGVAGQEPSAGAAVHSVALLQGWNEFPRHRFAPGAVIDTVGEFLGAGGQRLIHEDPDHLRELALRHPVPHGRRQPRQAIERAEEAMGVKDGGIATLWMSRIFGRCCDPGADMGRAAREGRQSRADEIEELVLPLSFGQGGDHLRLVVAPRLPRIMVRQRLGQGEFAAGRQIKLRHRTDQIASAGAAINIGVRLVEHRLDRIAAGRERRESLRKSRHVGVDIDGGARCQTADLLGGDGDLARMELVDAERVRRLAVIAGLGLGQRLRENQQAPGYRLVRRFRQPHMEDHPLRRIGGYRPQRQHRGQDQR